MRGQARDWLPVGATTHPAVRARIGAAVSAWSTQWFARRTLSAVSFTPSPGEPPVEPDGWCVWRATIAIGCSSRAAASLLDWALDANLGRQAPTSRDRQLIDAFERRVIEDLAAKVETALGVGGSALHAPVQIEAPLGAHGGLVVGIGDSGGGTLLSLAIPLAAALPACRAALGPPSAGRGRLDGLKQALGEEQVAIEAILGKAEIRLADLRTLAPGDVLVLGTQLAGAAELSLVGAGGVFARASLTEISGRMALSLQA